MNKKFIEKIILILAGCLIMSVPVFSSDTEIHSPWNKSGTTITPTTSTDDVVINGDLTVDTDTLLVDNANSTVGIGIAPSSTAKLTLFKLNAGVINLTEEDNQSTSHAAIPAFFAKYNHTANIVGSENLTGVVSGLLNTVALSGQVSGTGEITQIAASNNIVNIVNEAGDYKISTLSSIKSQYQNNSDASFEHEITNFYGIWAAGLTNTTSADFLVENLHMVHIDDATGDFGAGALAKWVVTTDAGIWLDKQTMGDTNNYGIVINGDESGADICFGGSQENCLYRDASDGKFAFDGDGIKTVGTAPAISSCGTTPSVAGSDFAGKVTVGTGVTNSCTVTFNNGYDAAPACNVTGDTNGEVIAATTTTSALIFTSSSDMDSDVIMYICVGL